MFGFESKSHFRPIEILGKMTLVNLVRQQLRFDAFLGKLLQLSTSTEVFSLILVYGFQAIRLEQVSKLEVLMLFFPVDENVQFHPTADVQNTEPPYRISDKTPVQMAGSYT